MSDRHLMFGRFVYFEHTWAYCSQNHKLQFYTVKNESLPSGLSFSKMFFLKKTMSLLRRKAKRCRCHCLINSFAQNRCEIVEQRSKHLMRNCDQPCFLSPLCINKMQMLVSPPQCVNSCVYLGYYLLLTSWLKLSQTNFKWFQL